MKMSKIMLTVVVVTMMRFPTETILEIHVSDCHRYMIQHKKYGSIPKKQRDKSSTTSESFTGWWFQPSHRHYSVGTTSNISEWTPSISKATAVKSSEPSICTKHGWVN